MVFLSLKLLYFCTLTALSPLNVPAPFALISWNKHNACQVSSFKKGGLNGRPYLGYNVPSIVEENSQKLSIKVKFNSGGEHGETFHTGRVIRVIIKHHILLCGLFSMFC